MRNEIQVPLLMAAKMKIAKSANYCLLNVKDLKIKWSSLLETGAGVGSVIPAFYK